MLILNYIPGFRRGNIINKFIGLFYYMCCLYIGFSSGFISRGIFLISIPFIIFGIKHAIINKVSSKASNAFYVWLGAIIIALVSLIFFNSSLVYKPELEELKEIENKKIEIENEIKEIEASHRKLKEDARNTKAYIQMINDYEIEKSIIEEENYLLEKELESLE